MIFQNFFSRCVLKIGLNLKICWWKMLFWNCCIFKNIIFTIFFFIFIFLYLFCFSYVRVSPYRNYYLIKKYNESVQLNSLCIWRSFLSVNMKKSTEKLFTLCSSYCESSKILHGETMKYVTIAFPLKKLGLRIAAELRKNKSFK